MEIKLSKKNLAEFNYNWEKLMNFCELLVDVNVKKSMFSILLKHLWGYVLNIFLI